MSRKPETMAWIVLWASFLLCCVLSVAVPSAVRWYLTSATDSQEATLEIIGGTVLVREPASQNWIGATNKMRLREGVSIRTDDVSRALLTFFDGSPIVLYPRTEITIVRSQVSRFEAKAIFLTFSVQRGNLRVGVAPQLRATQNFAVQTPDAVASFQAGSYSVEVTDAGSQVAVREGAGTVTAAGGQVNLRGGQRTVVNPGQPPSSPQRAARELVANGDFRQALAGWREIRSLEVSDDVEAKTSIVEEGGQQVVRFERRGSRNSHAEAGIVQIINKDVSDFLTLKLSLDVKLGFQSLSGGGFRGSEYPVMVQVRYKDVEGNEQLLVHGFFYQNVDNYLTTNGEQVLQSSWYPYEKPLLGTGGITPRPFQILSVQVSASGWDLDSMVRGIKLEGE